MPTWNYTGAVQTWTVPKTGRYRVVAMGAGGGIGTQNSEGVYSLGGKGSEVTGDIYLTAGQALKIVVGAKGKNAANSHFEWRQAEGRGVDKTTGGAGGIAGVFDSTRNLALFIGSGGSGGYDSCYLTKVDKAHTGNGSDGSIANVLNDLTGTSCNNLMIKNFDKVYPRYSRVNPDDATKTYFVDQVYGAGNVIHDDFPNPSGISGKAFTSNPSGFISTRQGINTGNASLSIELIEEGKTIPSSTDLKLRSVTATFEQTKPNASVTLSNMVLSRSLRTDEVLLGLIRAVHWKSEGSSTEYTGGIKITNSGPNTWKFTLNNLPGAVVNHQNTDIQIDLFVCNPAGVTKIPEEIIPTPIFTTVPKKVMVGSEVTVQWSSVVAPTPPTGFKPDPNKVFYALSYSLDKVSFVKVTPDDYDKTTFTHKVTGADSNNAVYRIQAYVKTGGRYVNRSSDFGFSNEFIVETPQQPNPPSDVFPAGTLESPAIIPTQTPTIKWRFTAPNKNDTQKAYLVAIYKVFDDRGLPVYNSGIVNSNQSFFSVPPGIIEENTFYRYIVHVFNQSEVLSKASEQYMLMNPPPSGLIIIGPEDTRRTGTKPSFEAVIGNDLEKDNQHFMIQLAEDAGFTKNVQTFRSNKDIQGWEAKLLNEDYQAITDEGVTSSYEGGSVRYTIQSDLQEGQTYFWRMAPVDATTGAQGVWSTARSIKIGNVLQFQLKKPITTSLAAERMVFRAKVKLPSDGKLPASLKMEACNNALDEEPAWENITEAYTQGKYHAFKNKTKSADSWALDVRITINANDSLGEIECDGFGLSFD
ncbi:glycine-rich protein [Brevibacillus laterosporus]|uniref:glycoside hydrolase family 78 protein n=1 Tax=Brevibacillus laterosporus TaxID=1465 RepID=UPI000839B264|nr:glycine-rich protein [Brevibacillus laterosporus]